MQEKGRANILKGRITKMTRIISRYSEVWSLVYWCICTNVLERRVACSFR
jgi:hypothetical protein